jgi:hypothetical protein
MEALVQIAREKDLLSDPRWERLAAGTLPDGEREQLRVIAEESDLGRSAYDAFRPFEPEAIDRMTDRVLESLAPQRPVRTTERVEGTRPKKKSSWVLATLVTACVVTVPAAAVYVLAIREPASLPGYELSVSGGEQELRSLEKAPAETHRLGPGSRLSIVLRPATRVGGPLAVRALALPERGGAARVWDPPAEISPDGAARLQITRESLGEFPPGPCELVFAIGRPGALPNGAPAMTEAARSTVGSPRDSLRIVHVRLILDGGGDERP